MDLDGEKYQNIALSALVLDDDASIGGPVYICTHTLHSELIAGPLTILVDVLHIIRKKLLRTSIHLWHWRSPPDSRLY